jgi:hypothetical protein
MRALPDIHKITAGLKDALLQLQEAAGNLDSSKTRGYLKQCTT